MVNTNVKEDIHDLKKKNISMGERIKRLGA